MSTPKDSDFWRTARRYAAQVPFMTDAVAAYFSLIDPKTPPAAKATLAGALTYLVVPMDLCPEGLIGPAGLVDDGMTLTLAVAAVGSHVAARHYRQAKAWLAGPDQ